MMGRADQRRRGRRSSARWIAPDDGGAPPLALPVAPVVLFDFADEGTVTVQEAVPRVALTKSLGASDWGTYKVPDAIFSGGGDAPAEVAWVRAINGYRVLDCADPPPSGAPVGIYAYYADPSPADFAVNAPRDRVCCFGIDSLAAGVSYGIDGYGPFYSDVYIVWNPALLRHEWAVMFEDYYGSWPDPSVPYVALYTGVPVAPGVFVTDLRLGSGSGAAGDYPLRLFVNGVELPLVAYWIDGADSARQSGLPPGWDATFGPCDTTEVENGNGVSLLALGDVGGWHDYFDVGDVGYIDGWLGLHGLWPELTDEQRIAVADYYLARYVPEVSDVGGL